MVNARKDTMLKFPKFWPYFWAECKKDAWMLYCVFAFMIIVIVLSAIIK